MKIFYRHCVILCAKKGHYHTCFLNISYYICDPILRGTNVIPTSHVHTTTTLIIQWRKLPYTLTCKMKFLPQNWHLNKRGCRKFVYGVLNHTMPNWIAQNWTMRSQTKACIAKSSYELCALLRYYAV